MSIAWGIGLMVASKVAENQEWVSESTAKKMMIGGAAVALGGAYNLATATPAVSTGAGAMNEAAVISAEAGGTSAEILAADGAVFGEEGLLVTADALGSSSAEIAAATKEAMLIEGSAISPTSDIISLGGADKAGSGYMLPAAMVGGQAISGYAQGEAAKDIEDRKIEERDRVRNRQQRWNVSTDGKSRGSLSMGEGLKTVNDRFFSSKPKQGLLS